MNHLRIVLCAVLFAVLVVGCQIGTADVRSSPQDSTALSPAADAPMLDATAERLPDDDGGIALMPIATGLDAPVYVAGDGTGRLFVVEKRGVIREVRDGVLRDPPFLDLRDRVGSDSSEQGLLSVAFHPHFAENGRLFVDYTNQDGDTVIAGFQADGDVADPHSEVLLLTIDQPYENHNGGQVQFGPDGYLYIGMGDGGSAGDPHGNGQNQATLLGKLLRIDVDHGHPYAIPSDNPALGGDARPEIWALGVRNPWRFSFDRATGDLYLADVGQDSREEIDVQRAGASGGANYGWNVAEGGACYGDEHCAMSQFVAPVAEYGHDQGCSVTGGYVYRGKAFPKLQGVYFFGDFCSGQIWSLREVAPDMWQLRAILKTDLGISSFGQDDAGEVYVVDLGGGLYRLVEA